MRNRCTGIARRVPDGRWRPALALLVLSLLVPGAAGAQAAPGRYELEFQGPRMGGVTGVGATYRVSGGVLVVELPPVSSRYPAVRLTRPAGLPAQPFQAPVGGPGDDAFEVEFSHPQLADRYVADAGAVRVTQVEDGRLQLEFSVVASPAGQAGRRDLRLHGRALAQRRR